MIKFEVVEKYKDKDINLPKRGTKCSAGYDIESAEDIVVPSLFQSLKNYKIYIPAPPLGKDICIESNYFEAGTDSDIAYSMDGIKDFIKKYKLRTMVPTGLKVAMEDNMVLEIHPRSSTGSNCLLQLANQTGIIDADYYNNPDNEGEIFIPLINLSPFDIKIKKGDKIAQGIFHRYEVTNDDEAFGERAGGFGSTDKISDGNVIDNCVDPEYCKGIDPKSYPRSIKTREGGPLNRFDLLFSTDMVLPETPEPEIWDN